MSKGSLLNTFTFYQLDYNENLRVERFKRLNEKLSKIQVI